MVPGRRPKGRRAGRGAGIVAVECFHDASSLNRVSERCDLVTCGMHHRILYCTVHAFSSDTMPPGLDQWSWRRRGKDHTVGPKNLRKMVMKIITRCRRGTRKKKGYGGRQRKKETSKVDPDSDETPPGPQKGGAKGGGRGGEKTSRYH